MESYPRDGQEHNDEVKDEVRDCKSQRPGLVERAVLRVLAILNGVEVSRALERCQEHERDIPADHEDSNGQDGDVEPLATLDARDEDTPVQKESAQFERRQGSRVDPVECISKL